MTNLNRDRLRQLLSERGISARALSLKVGKNDTLVRDLLTGKSRNPRGDTLMALAEALEVQPAELVSGELTLEPGEAPPKFRMLPIRRRVQAGAWLELDEAYQIERRYPAAADPRFPTAAQWLSEVVGDSMNAIGIVPGDLVHCVDVVQSGYSPRTGDIVEVERRRFDGMEVEVTLKQVEILPDEILLWPRSTNPRWQKPLSVTAGLMENEETTVAIVGFVIAKITRFWPG